MGSDEGFYSQLTDHESSAFQAKARRRRWPKGSTMFVEGDSSDHVLVVTAGRVKVSYFTDDGREIVLAVREPGDLIGDLSAIDGGPRSAGATAMESVEALLMSAGDFKIFLIEHPRVALLLLETLSARLRDADRKRIEFGAQDTVERVALRLVELAERFGEECERGIRINLPLSQQELAGWTGSSREAVAKALQSMRRRGWIETHRRGITILDVEALARRAT